MGGYGMTREEEIIEAGIDYTMSVRPMCIGALAFEEEIRQLNRNKSFEKGAEWADKTMIDKACEWLDSINTDYYMDSGIFQMNDLISDLRKYLEEKE